MHSRVINFTNQLKLKYKMPPASTPPPQGDLGTPPETKPLMCEEKLYKEVEELCSVVHHHNFGMFMLFSPR